MTTVHLVTSDGIASLSLHNVNWYRCELTKSGGLNLTVNMAGEQLEVQGTLETVAELGAFARYFNDAGLGRKIAVWAKEGAVFVPELATPEVVSDWKRMWRRKR
jgi:hypothetical protein